MGAACPVFARTIAKKWPCGRQAALKSTTDSRGSGGSRASPHYLEPVAYAMARSENSNTKDIVSVPETKPCPAPGHEIFTGQAGATI
jgi:hypothetical protein